MFMALPILALYECYWNTGELPIKGKFSSEQDAWLYDEECMHKYFDHLFDGKKEFKVNLWGFINEYKI